MINLPIWLFVIIIIFTFYGICLIGYYTIRFLEILYDEIDEQKVNDYLEKRKTSFNFKTTDEIKNERRKLQRYKYKEYKRRGFSSEKAKQLRHTDIISLYPDVIWGCDKDEIIFEMYKNYTHLKGKKTYLEFKHMLYHLDFTEIEKIIDSVYSLDKINFSIERLVR